MKTKIKTARERVDEYFEEEQRIATRNGSTVIEFPEQRAHLLKMLDNHARRAHERHARKNACFAGYKTVEVVEGGQFINGQYFDDTKVARLVKRK